MNWDVLETLYSLFVAGYLSYHLARKWGEGPQVVYLPAPVALPPHEPRAAQDMCRCSLCAPPFHQESPSEPV